MADLDSVRMFRLRRRTLSFALAALLGVNALAACGGDGNEDARPLSGATASQLQATLDEIEQTVANGDCDGAGDQTARLAQQVSSLPAGVNADLRDALASGTSRLQSLVDKQCEQAAPTTEAPPQTEPQEEQKDKQEDKQKPKKPKETEPQEEQQGGDQQQDGDGGEDGGGDEGPGPDTGPDTGPGTGGVTP
jgi:outer membrane biosynthesis protein TonB